MAADSLERKLAGQVRKKITAVTGQAAATTKIDFRNCLPSNFTAIA